MDEFEIMKSGVLLLGLVIISFSVPIGIKNVQNWKKTNKESYLRTAVCGFTIALYVFVLLVFFSIKLICRS